MLKKLLLILGMIIGMILISKSSHAQVSGCANAHDLNINPTFTVSDLSLYDPTIDYGCVPTSGQEFVYGYFEVCAGGTLTVHAWTGSSSNDADLVVWGPFSSVTNICSNLTASTIAGCAATSNYQDSVALGNVNAGDIYMISIVDDTQFIAPQWTLTGTAIVNSMCSANTNTNCQPLSGTEDFCLATVDTATQKYKLTWEKLFGNPVSYFEIYKYGLNQQFNLIDTVNYSSLSEYIDMSSNPNVMGAAYQLVTRDTCGGSWTNGGTIQPVFCQASVSTSNTVNVSWTAYLDWNNAPVYYVIYRGATPTTMVPIDSVPDIFLNYTDVNPLSGNSYYKIGVALNGTCVPSHVLFATVQSFSNSAAVNLVGIGEHANPLGIGIYPNPATGVVHIRGIENPARLIVTDMTGRIVMEQQLAPSPVQDLDVSALDKGIYQLHFSGENGESFESLVVQ